MEILVELFLRFRRYSPPGNADGPMRLTVSRDATVSDVLACLAIPDKTEKVVLLDGLVCTPDTVLTEGQKVTVFPPLEGG